MNNALKLRRLLIKRYAERWMNLLAWGIPSPDVQVRVIGPRLTILGRCHTDRIEICPRPDAPLHRDLATVLHELAHAADRSADPIHGPAWRGLYAAAVGEVTGHLIDAHRTIARDTMDAQAEAALAAWNGGE